MFILDRLQKKDAYRVFSEPADPNELPDYHEIIEHPMDFGTVRNKLGEGLYSNLEDLEADVFLICSNAMQYNTSDTVYFRQARSIQELAKRDFKNLKQGGDDGELQPKIVKRGRPPGKHMKKSIVSHPVGPELSSGATLASPEEHISGSNAYNLRKGPMLYRFQPTDSALNSLGTRNSENHSDCLSNWNDEFPAFILKADMKYGKKQFTLDEKRRDTYKQFFSFGLEPPVLSYLDGGVKQLTVVGLTFEHGYTRSLARFAANLGPVVWKIASKKIESVLPPGLEFGPGWVGENEASLPQLAFSSEKQKSSTNLLRDGHPSSPTTPSSFGVNSPVAYRSSLLGRENMFEAASRVNSQNELGVLRCGVSGSRKSLQTRQKSLLHSGRNGINGVHGYELVSETGMARASMPTGQSELEDASESTQLLGMASRSDTASTRPAKHIDSESMAESSCKLHSRNPDPAGAETSCTGPPFLDTNPSSLAAPEFGLSSGKPSQQVFSPHHGQYSVPVQPDLNVRFEA
ncbi:unnamed protein product [Ilex paraguariensis]